MAESEIVVVGGGFAGTMVAIDLIRAGNQGKITIIDRYGNFGRGIAYQTAGKELLLNVPAARMSPLPQEPDALVKWISSNRDRLDAIKSFGPESFIPRSVYGDFIQDLFRQTLQQNPLATVEEVIAPVEDVERCDTDWVVSGPFGKRRCKVLILALGNPPSAAPRELSALPAERIIYPWKGFRMQELSLGDNVICMGTGLTAVDVAITLFEGGFKGSIDLFSRHGLMPLSHDQNPLQPAKEPLNLTSSGLRSLFREVRAQCQIATAKGEPWQPIFDTLRPKIQSLWQSLHQNEQQRFLRHLSTYWDIHRHRLAPELGEKIKTLKEQGRIRITSGTLTDAALIDSGVRCTLRKRGSTHSVELHGSHLFLCTGPSRGVTGWQTPWISTLINSEFLEADNLGIGFRPTAKGARLGLAVLGTALRGFLWESTAVREISEQAQQVARTLTN
jgi:uncharacterized NAD(P)/FAD-binding protein YdhS